LALVLNATFIRQQAIREAIGAVIQHLSIDEIKKLKIPILHPKIQLKISSLIQESFKLRKEAKELIEKAKREVEDMIESM
jgi:restriction endonuclease S subunit